MSEGLSGRSLKRDLETMFQLIYLTFTQPRADAEAFSVMKGQLQAVLANRQARPEAAFADALNAAVSQNHLRARPMSPEIVAQMDLAKSMAFYKDRFADASDFTFVFVGSFDLATMKPLVERYLGSLPSLQPEGSGARRRHPSAHRRRREDGDEGARAAQPGGHRLHRAVQEHAPGAARRPHARGHARRQPAARAARGSRRHLRRQRRARLREAAGGGVPADDLVRLRSGAHRRSRQGAVQRHRRVQGRTDRATVSSPTSAPRCCATSKRTASRTASCCASSPTPTSTARTSRTWRRSARPTIS